MGWSRQQMSNLNECYKRQIRLQSTQAAVSNPDRDSMPDVEPGAESKPARKTENQGGLQSSIQGRVSVRIVAYRSRLADCDGLCGKWFVDEVIKAIGLPDDSLRYVASVQFEQVKCQKAEEKTVVQVWEDPGC